MLHYTRLESLARVKYSFLLCSIVSYKENEVLWIRPKLSVGMNISWLSCFIDQMSNKMLSHCKPDSLILTLMQNKLECLSPGFFSAHTEIYSSGAPQSAEKSLKRTNTLAYFSSTAVSRKREFSYYNHWLLNTVGQCRPDWKKYSFKI